MESWIQDLKHGVRLLARRPGFAAVADRLAGPRRRPQHHLFSVVNAVLLRNTPVQAPDRLVEIYSSLSDDFPYLTTSYPDYLSIRDEADAFSGVAAHAFVRGILSTGGTAGADHRRDRSPRTTSTSSACAPPSAAASAPTRTWPKGSTRWSVLSHGLWQRRFGGRHRHPRPGRRAQRREVHGRGRRARGLHGHGAGPRVRVLGAGDDGRPPQLPGHRRATPDHDPGATRIQKRGQRWLFVKGRLAEGRSVEQARAQVDTIFARLRQEYPDHEREDAGLACCPGAGVRFHPMLDGYVKAASAVLLAAVGARADHRLRQRGQHAAGPRRLAAPRAGRARGHRRRPRAAGAPAPEREPGAGRDRRGGRRAPRRLGRPDPDRPAHGLAARPRCTSTSTWTAPCSPSRPASRSPPRCCSGWRPR